MQRTLLAAFVISTAAVFAACGGSQPPAPATPPTDSAGSSAPKETGDAGSASTPAPSGTAATTAPASTGEAQPSFDSLPGPKKAEIMMTKVLPNVGKAFKEHDASKYGKFGCGNCHGPTKKEDPHKVLPKLTFSNGGLEKLQKSKGEMMKFMHEKVVPAMADALGEKPYDAATKQGFGCAGCHTID